jgi:DNA-binding SARP family transcriptional activator/tetratricopeptide (TPR) repeat protein
MILRIVGQSIIEVGPSTVSPTATHLFSLLLYLGLERDRCIGRSELLSLLFPENSAGDASHNLRQLLYRARRLGAPLISSQSTVFVDSKLVEDDLTKVLASTRLEHEQVSPGRFSLLPHYTPPTQQFSSWIEAFRDRTRTRLIRLVSRELECRRTHGDWSRVEILARTLLDIDAYNETATLCLAEALARLGSKNTALALLRTFESEVGQTSPSMALPPRLLARRIVETQAHDALPINIPMVGREKDIARLLAFWERARGGQFTAVQLRGTESVGKSRLASELASTVRLSGSGSVILTRRASIDSQRPLSLFSDIAKELLAMRGAAGCSPESLSYISRLTRASAVGALTEPERPDSAYSYFAVCRAVTDLIDSVVSERPLLLIVDDAQHLDDASLVLHRALQQTLATRCLLVLFLGRSSLSSDAPLALKERLAPLELADAERLASAINNELGNSLAPDVLARCLSLVAGNPGHLQMLLLEAARSHTEAIPAGLVAAIDARLGSLSAQALHVIQACVAFGSPCSSDDVSNLTGIHDYSLLTCFQELEDNALIGLRDARLQCVSGLVEERVGATTTPAVKALLHLRAARRMEQTITDATLSQATAWTIAEHWTEAGMTHAALRWRQRCWQQMLSIGQPMTALSQIRTALSHASTVEERGALLLSLSAALRALGDFTSLVPTLQQRIRLSSELNDGSALRKALAFDLFEAQTVVSPEVSLLIAPLREHLGDDQLDSSRRLRASRQLLIAADHHFDPVTAREAYDRFRDIQPLDTSATLSQLHASLIYHATFGDRAEAIGCIQRILDLSQTIEQSWIQLMSATSCVVGSRIVGEDDFPLDVLEHAFHVCVACGVDTTAIRLGGILTMSAFDDGRHEEARRWCQASGEVARRIPLETWAPDYPTGEIDLALLDGRYHRAEEFLRRLCSITPARPGPRMRREVLVYRTRVDQFSGRGTTDDDLQELQHFHSLGKTFGRHDDNAEVLWVALMERGAAEQASAMLAEYLTASRRELRRCNFWLRTRTAEDPIWRNSRLSRLS